MSETMLPARPKRGAETLKLSDPEIEEARNTLISILEKRKVSPSSRDLVQKALKDCEKALDKAEKDHEFERLKGSILGTPEWMELRLKNDEKCAEERRELQELRTHQFMLRYGDYLARICGKFRSISRELKVDKFAGRRWSEIESDLKLEDKLLKDWKVDVLDGKAKSETPPETPNTDHITYISNSCCLSEKEIRETIQTYVARNGVAHVAALEEDIDAKDYVKVAESLVRDKAKLHYFLPAHMSNLEGTLLKGLEMVQDEFFSKIKTRKNFETNEVEMSAYLLHKSVLEKDEREEKEKAEKENAEKELELQEAIKKNRNLKISKLSKDKRQVLKELSGDIKWWEKKFKEAVKKGDDAEKDCNKEKSDIQK